MEKKSGPADGVKAKVSPDLGINEGSENQSVEDITMATKPTKGGGEQNTKTVHDKMPWYSRLNPLKRKPIPIPEERNVVSGEYRAGFLSLLTFQWMSPLMTVGYRRPLELNDIWLVNPDRSTELLAAQMKMNFAKRVRGGSKRPLLGAMYDTFRKDFYVGGLASLTATLLQVVMPFVLKYLIAFASAAYFAAELGIPAPHIGQGLGLVFGISAMQIVGSIGNNHFMYRGMMLGGQIRSVLISIIFDKAMRISGRAKAGGKPVDLPPANIEPGSDAEKQWYAKKLNPNSDEPSNNSDTSEEGQPKVTSKINNPNMTDGIGWGNGRIINLMSTDTHRIDQSCGFLHMSWTAPLAIVVTLVLLIVNLTYSALAGFGIFFFSMPLLAMSMGALFRRRAIINKITDRRVTLTQEILQAVRFIKYYSWEQSFLDRVATIRRQEIRSIQILLGSRNLITSVGMSLPIFAAMLAFITYSLTHHNLDPASIFSSLALFNQIRMPLTFLPLIIGQIIDSLASVSRIEAFLLAEEQHDEVEWDIDNPNAVTISHASFTWERAPSPEAKNSLTGPMAKMQKKAAKKAKKAAEKAAKASNKSKTLADQPAKDLEEKEPFKIQDIDITLGRGELVAVIGTVGSGKSSLLSAIAGDMRQTSGSLTLGASRAFCPQQAWIRNATVEENITFGKKFDKAWFDKIVDACALRPDLAMLPSGRHTEIGERGINLSGGQKQRVNIARAIYFDADIVIMDDPLSAVDAHVGRHIMDEAICGLLKDKCRILATHQLHVLRRCDRIILMHEGRIAAIDTFDNLMLNNETFQTIMASVDTTNEGSSNDVVKEDEPSSLEKAVTKDLKVDLMQIEDRAVKAVAWNVYYTYMKATGSILVFPFVFFLLALSQAANILTGLWLAWWTSNAYNLSSGEYIGTYVALGFSQAFLMFGFSLVLTIFGTQASRTMHNRAIKRVLRAPMSFFDTTPLGRIMNRFSKDIDIMDNNLQDAMRMAFLTMASVMSIFILIIVYYPYFAIALGPLLVFYSFVAMYYRASAREVKRHEAVLRSSVFARFNESIFGTSTLRAYGLQDHFSTLVCKTVDDMDGAYYLTFSNQRWLGVRLDAVGVLVIFVTGLLVVTSRFSVSPSIGGLVLSYMIAMVQMLQFTVRQVTELENDMNATERVQYYGTNIEEEAPAHLLDFSSRPSWPEQGEINFQNVEMRYREDLPLVLQDFNLHVKAGERMAIVGRTGAGKSSIMATLFRLVELSGGSITIDDLNISTLGLDDLRSRMSIIPQDPTLFRGTIRSNLDPFDKYTDLELWSALRQANLVGADEAADDTTGRIQLDSTVDDEGSNFSLGQRQLLALARALVRGSQIIVCDEATSSVDFETDRRIQEAIFEGFKGKTLLCIAHRLKTIIGYDRVCVLDNGTVAELGTPLELFDNSKIFRGMCEKNSIDREEIIAAVRESHVSAGLN